MRAAAAHKKTRRKRGGRFISSGANGCGFAEPALRCLGEPVPPSNIFSKMTTIKEAESEYRIAATIREIDPDQKFSIYPTRVCEPDPSQPDNEVYECPLIHTLKINNSKRFRLLHMKMGGTSLYNKVFEPDSAVQIFESIVPVMEGLTQMHARNYYHLDIKDENMVIDSLNKIRLIDFGNALFARDFIEGKPRTGVFGNYLYWPYEMRWLERGRFPIFKQAFKLNSSWLQEDFTTFFNNGPYRLSRTIPPNIYYDSPTKAYANVDLMGEIFEKVMGHYGGYTEQLVGDLLGKIDVYSLAILLCAMYIAIFGQHAVFTKDNDAIIVQAYNPQQNTYYSKTLREKGANETRKTMTRIRDKISTPFYDLMYDMLELNPLDRLSMADATMKYKKWLAEMKIVMGDTEVMGAVSSHLSAESPVLKNISPSQDKPIVAGVKRRRNNVAGNAGNQKRTRRNLRNLSVSAIEATENEHQ